MTDFRAAATERFRRLTGWTSGFRGAANEHFRRLTDWTANATGSPIASGLALGIVLGWVLGGFIIGFNNTLYQLLINTGTTIVTFLMVFLIQASTNRIGRATQMKLDEIIVAIDWIENDFAGIEHLSEAELDRLEQRLLAQREAALRKARAQPA
jgi:low affinity Fe/Cu permease